MADAAAAPVLFRLGGRGYACPRDKVRQVVDVGGGKPPVPGLEPSSLSALEGAHRPLPLRSWACALSITTTMPRVCGSALSMRQTWMPSRRGIMMSSSTRLGRS